MRGVLISACAILGLLGAASAASAGSSLSELALKPAQIGAGYTLQTRPDTSCVQRCVTLDLCGADFLSEVTRTGRYQVDYPHRGRAVQFSNEIVRYRPRGTVLARDEIAEAAATCPKTPVGSHVKGTPPITYRIKRLHDARLLPGSVALQVHFAYRRNGKAAEATSIQIYQFRGDVLSALYVYPAPGIPIARAISFGFEVAAASAANLRRSA